MMDMKVRSLNHLASLVKGQLYAGAKNLTDWCAAQWPDAFDPADQDGSYRMWAWADAAKNLCDYSFALKAVRALREKNPDYFPDTMRSLEETCCREMEESKLQPLFCENERLRGILGRLLYIYDAIDKPVHIFVAENEEAYQAFHAEAFPGKEISSYDRFQACCMYGDPQKYWIVFKAEYLTDDIADEEILGLCAHEMGHLDLQSKGITEKYAHTRHFRKNDLLITERLNDLYVLSKGLAWPLYRSRIRFGAAPAVMSPEEIQTYILKLADHR